MYYTENIVFINLDINVQYIIILILYVLLICRVLKFIENIKYKC